MFVESYQCQTQINKDGIIKSVVCDETSTFKRGARGSNGVQAVVKQELTLKSSRVGYDKRSFGSFDDVHEIGFEYTDKSVDDLEYKSLDINKFLTDLCTKTAGKSGLDKEHANNFRALVNKIESYSEADFLKLYEDGKKKCEIAG